MLSRRDFLKTGLLTSGALLAPQPVLATSATVARQVIELAVFDSRYGAGRDFASAARQMGLLTLGFEGDITGLWYHDLYHRWGKPSAAITGLTGEGALFCLEHLAWDAGLRVTERTVLPIRQGETLLSWVIAARHQNG